MGALAMDHREEKIRARANELWEQAGRPEGQETAHWAEAERMIDDQEDGPEAGLGVNPGRTGPAQPDQVETLETEIPVKRKKKESMRPSGKRTAPE